jgi:hypothetical protein
MSPADGRIRIPGRGDHRDGGPVAVDRERILADD